MTRTKTVASGKITIHRSPPATIEYAAGEPIEDVARMVADVLRAEPEPEPVPRRIVAWPPRRFR